MTRPVRVGLIGANWGLTHVAGWKAVPGAEIVAICTSRRETAEAVAKDHGIPRPMWNASALINDPDIDVVDITVRPTIRAPLALEAVLAGKSMIQTMPFALNLRQGHDLKMLAANNGAIAMMESLHRHSPAFRQVKALLEEGIIGPVQSIRGHVRTGILLSAPPHWEYLWITEPKSGASALRNFGAHLLHTICWFFGPIESVAAQITTNLPEIRLTDGSSVPNGVSDTAAVLLHLRSGVEGVIDVSWCTPGSEGFQIDAIGSTGRLRVSADLLGPQNARIELASTSGGPFTDLPLRQQFLEIAGAPNIRENPTNPFVLPVAAMCYRLAEAVQGRNVSYARPDFSEAYHVMQVVEAAYRAHERKAWISVEEVSAEE